MLYIYVLGCGLACLVLAGISSMETVDVKPARVAAEILLWPAAASRAPSRLFSFAGQKFAENTFQQ